MDDQDYEDKNVEIEKSHTLARQRELSDLSEIMSSDAGKRFIWRLLERTGVYQQTFVPDSPHSTSFNEGRRSVGNRLLVDINSDPDCTNAFSEIIKQNQEG